jgi:tRNA-binding protein
VVAVVNFPPKQIADFMSECLVLGTLGPDKEIVLLQPERPVPNGLRIG